MLETSSAAFRLIFAVHSVTLEFTGKVNHARYARIISRIMIFREVRISRQKNRPAGRNNSPVRFVVKAERGTRFATRGS